MSLLSESHYLRILDEYFCIERRDLLVPRGDDAAVFSWDPPLCMSSDLFIQDVHFRHSYFSPQDIGYKSLAINISDISAMGARPLGFDMNVLLPAWVDEEFWRRFLHGMSTLAREYDLLLLGGDLVKTDRFGVSITILGDGSGRHLQRCCVGPGDILFVVGNPGLAGTGFCILEKGEDKSGFEQAVKAHLRPELFVDLALSLGKESSVKGLMDVSDGLLTDLPRFVGESYGVELTVGREDLHPEVLWYADNNALSPEIFALQGGEDYVLLGGCSTEGFEELRHKVPGILKIGEVSAKQGLFLQGEKLDLQGFDHFRG